MKVIKWNFSLQPETMARIRKYAKKTMVPMSRIADRAINEYLDRQDTQSKGRAV